jgi:DNA-binding MarR family transcriptional regulator
MQSAESIAPQYERSVQSLLEQAKELQAQAAELAAIIRRPDSDSAAPLIGNEHATLTRGIIRARDRRFKFFPRSLFADPAWDILLELYSAELAGRKVSVSQVCAAAHVPATTALRWLNTLEANRLVERNADPLDARRFFVSLAESGRQAMEGFLGSINDSLRAS